MPESDDAKNEAVLTEDQQQKIKEWNAKVRQKHCVPDGYCVMIDRANIDLVIDNEVKYENIPVYDEWGTLCNCSYGIITPICKEKFEEGKLHERVARWKAAMLEKYKVPDEYEVLMNYGVDNDIDHWIANCEQKGRIVVKDYSDRFYSMLLNGNLQYMPFREEYLHYLANPLSDKHGSFSQDDSDIIGHFLQVVLVLQESSWFKHKVKLQSNMNRDGKTRADMPALEQTVFALLYVRQLIDSNDHLVNSACKKYVHFSSNSEKRDYIKEQQKKLLAYLNVSPQFIELANIVKNNMELIEVFQYGALIMHGPDNVKDPQMRDIFKQMYLHKNMRANFIFTLNKTLRQIVCQASAIAVFIKRDFGIWISEGKVPRPDVMWQNSMFAWEALVEEKKVEDCTQQEPVFGVAYNVQISEVKK